MLIRINQRTKLLNCYTSNWYTYKNGISSIGVVSWSEELNDYCQKKFSLGARVKIRLYHDVREKRDVVHSGYGVISSFELESYPWSGGTIKKIGTFHLTNVSVKHYSTGEFKNFT